MILTLADEDVETAIRLYVESKVNTATQEVLVSAHSKLTDLLIVEVRDKPKNQTPLINSSDITVLYKDKDKK